MFVSFREDDTVGYRVNMVASKRWNDFVSSMWPDVQIYITTYNQDGVFEFWAQIASKMFSEYIIRSHSEACSQLKENIYVFICRFFMSFDITRTDYRKK